LKDDGAACGADSECTSSHCADGVCCDTACSEQCAACDATGSKGKCTAVTGAPHGTRKACDGTAPCVGKCDGKLLNACAYPSTAVSCGSDVGCSDGGTTEQKCNGFGRCIDLPTTRCAPFTCSAGACNTSCDKDGDCAFGYRCEGQSCVLPDGSSCPDGGQSCTPPPAAAAADEGGCGCRVGTQRESTVGWFVGLLCVGALARTRRHLRCGRPAGRQGSG
jgi:MYXO-CTERM domain-containing protein